MPQFATVIDLAAVREKRRQSQPAKRPAPMTMWVPVWVTLVPVWRVP